MPATAIPLPPDAKPARCRKCGTPMHCWPDADINSDGTGLVAAGLDSRPDDGTLACPAGMGHEVTGVASEGR